MPSGAWPEVAGQWSVEVPPWASPLGPPGAVCVWGEGIGVKPGLQDLRPVTRGLQ